MGLALFSRGTWHIVTSFSKQRFPFFGFRLFLFPEFGIYSGADFLRVDIASWRDTVLYWKAAVFCDSVSSCLHLLGKESTFHLVASFLVTGRSLFSRYVPTMVVNISGISAGISCLRISSHNFFVCKTRSDQELLVCRASRHHFAVISRNHTLLPLWWLHTKHIAISSFNQAFSLSSHSISHMLFPEKSVRWRIIQLTVSDWADGFACGIELRVSHAASCVSASKNVLCGSGKSADLARSFGWVEVSLLLILKNVKKKSNIFRKSGKIPWYFRQKYATLIRFLT